MVKPEDLTGDEVGAPELLHHVHQWGDWHRVDARTVEPGDVTRSRWCACGAYEMWTKNDPVTTSRDLSYRVKVPSDNER